MHLKDFFLSWGMLFVGVILNVAGIYFVKMKINHIGVPHLDSFGAIFNYFTTLGRSPLVIVGLFLFFVACLPYAIALSRMELSVAYPVSVALNCLILIPLSIIFLKEDISWSKVTGIGMILTSLYLLYK